MADKKVILQTLRSATIYDDRDSAMASIKAISSTKDGMMAVARYNNGADAVLGLYCEENGSWAFSDIMEDGTLVEAIPNSDIDTIFNNL